MAFTREQLAALDSAIAAAGNAADVSYGDGARIRYLTPTEASQLRELMLRDVVATENAAAAVGNFGAPLGPLTRGARLTFRSGY